MDVSVIIPCYNVEEYVEECIDSVLSQSHVPIEILCVDNNSTDGTLQKLQALADAHTILKVLEEPRPGASFARNTGLAVAKGGWIQFLDADDLLKSQKIQHQLRLIESWGERPDFVVGSCVKRSAQGDDSILHPISDLWQGLFVTRLGNTCSNLWNKSSLDKIDGWNSELASSQESDLMFRLLKNGNDRVLFDREPLTIIRERESGQISSSNLGSNLIRYAELRLEMANFILKSRPEVWSSIKSFVLENLIILSDRLSGYEEHDIHESLSRFTDEHRSELSLLLRVKLTLSSIKAAISS